MIHISKSSISEPGEQKLPVVGIIYMIKGNVKALNNDSERKKEDIVLPHVVIYSYFIQVIYIVFNLINKYSFNDTFFKFILYTCFYKKRKRIQNLNNNICLST